MFSRRRLTSSLFTLGHAQRFSLAAMLVIIPGFYITPEIASKFRAVQLLIVIGLLYSSGFSALQAVRKASIGRSVSWLLSLHIFLLIYGLWLSALRGTSMFSAGQSTVQFFSASLLLSLVLAQYFDTIREGTHEATSESNLLGVFFAVGTGIALISGALTFVPFPLFKFSTFEGVFAYSQKTTALYGLASMYFLHLSVKKVPYVKISLYVLSLLCLLLSAFSGARGDFLVSVLVLVMMSLRLFPLVFTLQCAMVALGSATLIASIVGTDDILLVQRFLVVLSGDTLGMRDVFVAQGLDLLANEPICMLSGCGFNYFQSYYGYQNGSYPHNIPLELLITFGAFIGGSIVCLAVLGIWRAYRSNVGRSYLFYFCVFYYGLGFKSGTLVSVHALPVVLVFVVFCFVGSGGSYLAKDSSIRQS